MGGFNPINLIMNTMALMTVNYGQPNSANINTSNANQANAKVANSSQNINTNQTSFLSQNNLSSLENTNIEVLSSAKQAIISTVEVEQRANYIKELLNLPKDFETLINEIQSQNPETQALRDLAKLLQGGKINLAAFHSLMSENQKNAVQKLMMTIMTVSKMGSLNVRQLKELVNLFQNSSSANSSELVKNIVMLYLPWLPLSVRNEMNLNFRIDIYEKNGSGEDEKEKSETIKILIQTANFGNVLCELTGAKNGDVDVFISANESFPEEEVLSELKKEKNIRTNVTVEKNKDPLDMSQYEKNIQIISSDFVSPKLLMTAHSLIKIIIELDFSNFIINEDSE